MPRSSPAAWILAPIVAAVLAIALVGTAGCAGAPASRHTVGSVADGPPGAPADVDADLRALEAERARALVAADVATLERLLAPELRYGHANGVVESRAQFLERLGSGALRYERVEPTVVTVQTAGDAALVRGTVALRALGPTGAVDATLAYLAVHVRRDGRWQLLGYQSAVAAR
jgi:hypothetical protein